MHGPAAPELVLPLELPEPELVLPLELPEPGEPPAPLPVGPDPQALMTTKTPRIPSPGTAARRIGDMTTPGSSDVNSEAGPVM
jgi:hypothetical protein